MYFLSTYAIAEGVSANELEQDFSSSLRADEHYYIFANTAHKIMNSRQNGEKASKLFIKIQKFNHIYNKSELFELVKKAY